MRDSSYGLSKDIVAMIKERGSFRRVDTCNLSGCTCEVY